MEDQSSLSVRPLFIAVTLALAGYAHAADEPASRQEPVTASVTHQANAVASERYAAEIGESRFESRHLELKNNGYTVQSGVLLGARGEEGALVLVQAPDGALTGIVSRPGKSGLLQVSPDGKRTFHPDAEVDFMRPDTVPSSESEQVAPPGANAEVVVDALVGFTQSALQQIDVSPVAYALSQMEYVNLSLRNSRVDNVRLNLAGIRIYDEDIPVTGAGLERWQALLTPLRSGYRHDINVGYSVGGDAGGWAFVPGFTSVNLISASSAFKHEMGHNVGGSHCNDDGSDNYRFGYDTGDDAVRTNLCGNSTAYYSNPDITYQGRRMGDARTANMARLWREQASRLGGYSSAYDGLRVMHVGRLSVLSVAMSNPLARPYFVASAPAVGPTGPENVLQGLTRLNVPLRDANGQIHTVVMRGGCKSPINTLIPMHSSHGCNLASEAMLILYAEPEDNLQLPAGWYNGPLELNLRSPEGDKKILVSVSVRS